MPEKPCPQVHRKLKNTQFEDKTNMTEANSIYLRKRANDVNAGDAHASVLFSSNISIHADMGSVSVSAFLISENASLPQVSA